MEQSSCFNSTHFIRDTIVKHYNTFSVFSMCLLLYLALHQKNNNKENEKEKKMEKKLI